MYKLEDDTAAVEPAEAVITKIVALVAKPTLKCRVAKPPRKQVAQNKSFSSNINSFDLLSSHS